MYSLITQNIPVEKGKLLLESRVQNQKDKESLPAFIYQNCIVINGLQAIHYNFDICFVIESNSICFSHMDQTVKFILPLSDQLKWKQHLRNYLNQKGFHQEFKPIKKIGKGNFASVYLAQKIQTHVKYAVKAFSKQAAFSEENGKECLIKEIQIMRHLNHKNNMKLYQVFQSDNSLYIVFQLLEGGQLYDSIKAKHKFTVQQIKAIIHGLLEGLRQMHSKNIMHRDLKPENILFRKEGDYDCVIADYGLAEFANEENYLFVRCGTPGYVAPEVINIKDMKTKYSPVCDMFSLGLIFHHILMGKSVFKGTTYNQILSQNRACDFSLDGPEYDKISAEALDLLRKMLRTNPEERITAEQAIDHPYFKQQSQEENLHEIEEEIMDKLNAINVKTNEETEKPMIKKDSCVTFKLGKQNVFTGKTETKGNVNSGRLSFGGRLLNGLPQKESKFAAQLNKPDS